MKTVCKTKESHLTEIRRPCLDVTNYSKVRNATWTGVKSSLDTQEEFEFMQREVKKSQFF